MYIYVYIYIYYNIIYMSLGVHTYSPSSSSGESEQSVSLSAAYTDRITSLSIRNQEAVFTYCVRIRITCSSKYTKYRLSSAYFFSYLSFLLCISISISIIFVFVTKLRISDVSVTYQLVLKVKEGERNVPLSYLIQDTFVPIWLVSNRTIIFVTRYLHLRNSSEVKCVHVNESCDGQSWHANSTVHRRQDQDTRVHARTGAQARGATTELWRVADTTDIRYEYPLAFLKLIYPYP